MSSPPVSIDPSLATQRKPSPLDKVSEPTKVTSLNEYMACVAKLWEPPTDRHERFYFRGQYAGYARDAAGTEDKTKAWKLNPSLARIMRSDPSDLVSQKVRANLIDSCGGRWSGIIIQSFLLHRLKRLAEQHYPSVAMGVQQKLDFITWLSIAQHHKVPTYLMDWSVNPLVGLYFAIEDAFADKDPAMDKNGMDGDVWVFDLVPLEGRPEAYLSCFLHLDELDMSVPCDFNTKLQRKAEKRTMKTLLQGQQLERPIVIVPRLTARRIDSQAARFVYWDGDVDLETYTLGDDDPTNPPKDIRPWRRLKKLCWIPKDRKQAIAEELAHFRIHPGTIDADLDGYARYLRWAGH